MRYLNYIINMMFLLLTDSTKIKVCDITLKYIGLMIYLLINHKVLSDVFLSFRF